MPKMVGLVSDRSIPSGRLKEAARLLVRRTDERLHHALLPFGEIWWVDAPWCPTEPVSSPSVPFFLSIPLRPGYDAAESLRVFEKAGIYGLDKVGDGQAFVISTPSKLVVSTDHLGLQFVYVHARQGFFAFSTEMKCLLALFEDLRKDVNLDALCGYLKSGCFFGDATAFEGISLLEPSTAVEYRIGEDPRRILYHRFPSNYRKSERESEVSGFWSKLSKEVDEDIFTSACLFLSGGMDSRMIASSIPDSKKQKVLCVNFGRSKISDCRFARKVAETLHLNYKFIRLDVEDILREIQYYQWLTDGDPHIFAAYLTGILETLTAGEVMDGFMGDVVAGGNYVDGFARCGIRELSAQEFVKKRTCPDSLMKRVLSTDAYRRSQHAVYRQIQAEISKFEWVQDDLLKFEYLMIFSQSRRLENMSSILIRDFCWSIRPFSSSRLFHYLIQVPPEHRSQQALYFSALSRYCPRMIAVPSTRRYRATQKTLPGRFLGFLRKAIAKLSRRLNINIDLPEDSYVPIAFWFRRNKRFREFMLELLTGRRTIQRGLYNISGIWELIREHDRRERDHSYLFQRLAWVELFLRIFHDGDGFEMFCD